MGVQIMIGGAMVCRKQKALLGQLVLVHVVVVDAAIERVLLMMVRWLI